MKEEKKQSEKINSNPLFLWFCWFVYAILHRINSKIQKKM